MTVFTLQRAKLINECLYRSTCFGWRPCGRTDSTFQNENDLGKIESRRGRVFFCAGDLVVHQLTSFAFDRSQISLVFQTSEGGHFQTAWTVFLSRWPKFSSFEIAL